MMHAETTMNINGKTVQRVWSLHIWWHQPNSVLSSTGIRFTTVGRLRNDSGWSWTFWIARVTLHDVEVAPYARLRVIVFAICLAFFPWEFRPWPSWSNATEKIHQIRAYAFGVQFFFKVALSFWILNIGVPFFFVVVGIIFKLSQKDAVQISWRFTVGMLTK